ncbi:hypothetical protein KEM55_003865 [Ascosphaera atra]|nr:hypothetical protein KEM55_003865 [Ascosphaera atra]
MGLAEGFVESDKSSDSESPSNPGKLSDPESHSDSGDSDSEIMTRNRLMIPIFRQVQSEDPYFNGSNMTCFLDKYSELCGEYYQDNRQHL